jgi:hypothetical protein
VSRRDLLWFVAGLAAGVGVGVMAALLWLPPNTSSLVLGAGLGALALVIVLQIADLIRTIRY